MEQCTIFVSDDGKQFDTAEECQRYEHLKSLIVELSDHRNPVPMALAPHRQHVDSFLKVLRNLISDPHLPEGPQDPVQLKFAVDALIYLADALRGK